MTGSRVRPIAFIFALSLLAASASASSFTTKDIGMGMFDAYMPKSIKANQEAFMVVTGMFPNSCYTFNSVEVTHIDDFTHKVRAIARVQSGVPCERVMKPFTEEVVLGTLKEGEHKIIMASDDDTFFEKPLIIR